MNNSNSFEASAFVELEEKTVTAEKVLEGLLYLGGLRDFLGLLLHGM